MTDCFAILNETFGLIWWFYSYTRCMFTILYTAVITTLILMMLHHLYNYLKTHLTIPQVHDVLLQNTQKYKEIQKVLDPELEDYLKQFKKT